MRSGASVDRGWIFRGCSAEVLSDVNLGGIFEDLVRKAGFTTYGSASRKFDGGGGVTAVVIIGESSADIHTWPENGTAHLRLFYCHYSEDNTEKAVRLLELAQEHFKPQNIAEVSAREFPV